MDKNTTYQTGNTAATKFESLVNRLYVSLCFAANRFLGDKTAAQDIVQEAFARLWELQGKNKNIENIDNYMYMLVHNLSLEWLRTRKLQAKQPSSERGQYLQCHCRSRRRHADSRRNRKTSSP